MKNYNNSIAYTSQVKSKRQRYRMIMILIPAINIEEYSGNYLTNIKYSRPINSYNLDKYKRREL